MKKYLIEFIGAIGAPHFQRVTELTPEGKRTALSGDCVNFRDIPQVKKYLDNYPTGSLDGHCLEEKIEAEFTHKFYWLNFRKKWIECDHDKYIWCMGKSITVKIEFKFIG